ncbi:hypothetical protein D9M69_160830 [compost metagenome]
MEAKFEVHDDAEVAAATLQGPQQVGVFRLARMDEVTAGGNHIGGHQIVAAKAVRSPQPADAARQGKSGHACG